jgi:pyroglutamyl-peptidase
MKRTAAPLLLTGFAPFGGEHINPSWLVAQALHGESIAGSRVIALQLPCEFGAAIDVMTRAISDNKPRVVLALGQAGGRSDLSLERVAINIDDARIPDNAGAQPIDEPVCAGAPAAYFSTLPIKAIVAALHEAGVPASVSQTAGTYVCNHVFYALMHSLRRSRGVRAGFMHVPLLPEQAAAYPGQPSMALNAMMQGARLALLTAATVTTDLRRSGGAVS